MSQTTPSRLKDWISLLSQAQCEGGISQLQFIERYILGKKRKFTWETTDNPMKPWLRIIPDPTNYSGTALINYVSSHREDLSLDELVDYEYFHDCLRAQLGDFRVALSHEDGGIITRNNAPFFNDPPVPIFTSREKLPPSSPLIGKIELLQRRLQSFRDSSKDDADAKFKLYPVENTALKMLMIPYEKTMSNLVGGVHSCTTDTALTMVNLLKFNPKKTVLLECGCGAPFLGLSASIFARKTICIDVPSVMKTIFLILSFMSNEDKLFAQTIQWVPGP